MEVTSPWMAMAAAWMPMGILYLLFYLIFVVPPLFLVRTPDMLKPVAAVVPLARSTPAGPQVPVLTGYVNTSHRYFRVVCAIFRC